MGKGTGRETARDNDILFDTLKPTNYMEIILSALKLANSYELSIGTD